MAMGWVKASRMRCATSAPSSSPGPPRASTSELIAAEAGDRIFGAGSMVETAGDVGQELIADLVAQAVVDEAHAVDVDCQHSATALDAAALHVGQDFIETRGERVAPDQRRDAVDLIAGGEVSLLLLACGDVADDPDAAHRAAIRAGEGNWRAVESSAGRLWHGACALRP